ncbi:MAG: tetratricopeptide repeat protein [Trebonia sp.]
MQQPRDFSLYGAVDLGARQAAAQRRQQAAARTEQSGATDAAGGAASEFIVDVTEENFNEVALRSRTLPVIIDMFGDTEQSRQMSSDLEKLVAEAAGAWLLGKIDVYANQRLAAQLFQMLQTQSVPLVLAIVDGQPAAVIPGAVPEDQLRQWLDQVLGLAAQMDLGDSAEPGQTEDMPPQYAEAQDAIERGDLDAAAGVLEKALADSPADSIAKGMLAQVNLIRRVGSYDQAAVLRDAAAGPDDVEAQIKAADVQLASGQAEAAFDRLLGVVKRTSGDDRNKARLHLLDLFEIFGPDDPTVKQARSRLTTLLF